MTGHTTAGPDRFHCCVHPASAPRRPATALAGSACCVDSSPAGWLPTCAIRWRRIDLRAPTGPPTADRLTPQCLRCTATLPLSGMPPAASRPIRRWIGYPPRAGTCLLRLPIQHHPGMPPSSSRPIRHWIGYPAWMARLPQKLLTRSSRASSPGSVPLRRWRRPTTRTGPRTTGRANRTIPPRSPMGARKSCPTSFRALGAATANGSLLRAPAGIH